MVSIQLFGQRRRHICFTVMRFGAPPSTQQTWPVPSRMPHRKSTILRRNYRAQPAQRAHWRAQQVQRGMRSIAYKIEQLLSRPSIDRCTLLTSKAERADNSAAQFPAGSPTSLARQVQRCSFRVLAVLLWTTQTLRKCYLCCNL